MVNPEESFVLSKIKRTPVERELSAETNPLLFLFQSYVRLRRLELANDEVSSQTCLWFSCDTSIYSQHVLFSCEVSLSRKRHRSSFATAPTAFKTRKSFPVPTSTQPVLSSKSSSTSTGHQVCDYFTLLHIRKI